MALADATVRVILDVTRFERDLTSKTQSAARKAGRAFEREFTRRARDAGRTYAQEFQVSAEQGMAGAGVRAGQRFGASIRRTLSVGGRLTGRQLGEQIRSGLVDTAPTTGRRYGLNLLASSISGSGTRIGQALSRAIAAGIGQGGAGSGVGRRIQRNIEEEAGPAVVRAAATVAQRFGRALSVALGAIAPGRMVILGAAITALVTEGAQLAAAVAPALQAIGLVPAAVSVAAAAIGTLVVAFQGMGDAIGAALTGDTEKLTESLQKLAPAAQSVVREFGVLGPQLKQVQQQVQQAFFAPLVGDITNLGRALIGPVRVGMVSVAGAAGELASRLLDVAARARNAGTIEQIFQGAANAFRQMTSPLATVTQGMFDWVRATLPAIDQLVATLARGTQQFGQFLSRAAASGQAMAWVNEGITTLSQLFSVVRNLGGVLGDVFSAANAASGGYLNNLNQALLATRNFLAVGEGRAALVDIFQGLHRVLQALASPLRETVLQLGTVAQVAGNVASALSAGLTAAIRGIGQAIGAAGPGLTAFAQSVGNALTSVAASLPSIGASIGRLLSAVAPLTSVLGLVAQGAAALLSVFSSLPSGLLTAIAAFVALRALGVPNLFQQIADRARQLPAATSGVGAAFSSLSSTYQTNLAALSALRQQQAQTAQVMSGGTGPALNLATAFNSLGDRARAAAGAMGGALRTIGSGLLSLVGGGIGLAVAGVAALVSIWSSANDEAARKVAEHNQRVAALGSTLDKTTGSITNATREQARSQFSSGELADAARRLSLSIDLVADAATNTGPAASVLNSILQESAETVLRTSDRFTLGRQEAERYGLGLDTIAAAARGNTAAQDQVRAAVDRYASSLSLMERSEFDAAASTELLMGLAREMIPDQIALGDAASRTAADLQKQAEAVRRANEAISPMQKLAVSLGEAMNTLASHTSSAADKTRALDTALRILSGGTLDVQEAQKKAVDALTQGNEKLDELSKKYDVAGKSAQQLGISNQELAARQAELGQSLFDSAGNINFYSERANTLFTVSKDLRQATLDQTAAIIDNAQKTGGDLTKAHQQAADVMGRARQRVIEWARELGFSETEAKQFADSLHLIPEDVKVALTMPGVPALLSTLGQIKGRIELLPDNKTLRLDSNAAPMRGQLEALGFTIQQIPGTKDFTIVPNTNEAAAALDTFIRQSIIERRPDMIIGGNIDVGKASAEQLRNFIQSLPATITPSVNPGPAQGQARALLDALIPPPGTPQITPGINPGPAQNGLTGLLGGLTPPPGTPQISPGLNPGTAQGQLPGLLGSLTPPSGTPQISPGLNPGPALGTLNGFVLPSINQSRADVGVGIQPASAQQGLFSLLGQINASRGSVNVSANTSPAFGDVGGLVTSINTRSAAIQVSANPSSANSVVNALVQSINNRTATITVRANTAIQAAEGGIFAYRHGGIHPKTGMRPMPANRAEIVPPRAMRVIGDRAAGKEAFIPLVNSARSRAIFRAAADQLGFEVARRGEQRTGTTVNVEAGAITVNAPQANPELVARKVINELAREVVI